MTHIPTLVGQLLATNNNLQEKAAVVIIEQNRRIAELEAQLTSYAATIIQQDKRISEMEALVIAAAQTAPVTEDQCSRCGGADFMACGCTPEQQLAAAIAAK
jgi:hypothetical protein